MYPTQGPGLLECTSSSPRLLLAPPTQVPGSGGSIPELPRGGQTQALASLQPGACLPGSGPPGASCPYPSFVPGGATGSSQRKSFWGVPERQSARSGGSERRVQGEGGTGATEREVEKGPRGDGPSREKGQEAKLWLEDRSGGDASIGTNRSVGREKSGMGAGNPPGGTRGARAPAASPPPIPMGRRLGGHQPRAPQRPGRPGEREPPSAGVEEGGARGGAAKGYI